MTTLLPSFVDLPDLASETVGGAVLAANDEFFAEKENLLKPAAAVWKDHLYTDRGKWMDGWETRRFRPADGVAPGPGSDVHDWCLIRLGMPGVIRGVVVDTAWFRGNYPAACKLYGTEIDAPLDLAALADAAWTEIVPYTDLAGDSKNAIAVTSPRRFTHLRFEIYPDGGVARLRVHGEAVPRWPRLRALGGAVDLAALENGAVVETCSDMFFGSRNNLIAPGHPQSMADGWETRRRRGPGHEWAIVRLAAPGTIERLLLDTSFFKGNAPALCAVDGVYAPDGQVGPTSAWRPLLPRQPVQAHTRHTFEAELRRLGPVTHLRLSSYPCGGVARLRAWGYLTPEVVPGLARLNALPVDEARAALARCCGSKAWVDAMLAHRPFADRAALLRTAEAAWWALGEADHREAFAAHPRIGEARVPASGDATWSTQEQQAAASAEAATLARLADLNRRYDATFGFIFIICATGRSAASMADALAARIDNPVREELRTAAEEQAKITRLRLTRLCGELA